MSARILLPTRRLDCEVVGFLDEPNNGALATDSVCKQPLGTVDELEQILMREVIDEVVMALPVKSCYQQIQHAIGVCERAGVQATYAADLFESTVAFPVPRPWRQSVRRDAGRARRLSTRHQARYRHHRGVVGFVDSLRQ